MANGILGIPGLSVQEYGISANAVLGTRDSGKTYTGTKAAEELFDAGIPFIALDPIGVWHSLRIAGKGKGYPVVVAGGRHGDLPLTVKTAGQIVRAAMENNISLVVDLFSADLSKADWKRIVRETCDILLHENFDHGLRHVFIEEAAEFVPQRLNNADGQVFAAVEKLVRMGGNAKIGITLINQRSADLNKSVLELCATALVHRQIGKNTLLDLHKWFEVMDLPDKDQKAIAKSLPEMTSGTCWVLSTAFKRPICVTIPPKNSLHPDRRAVIAKGAGAVARADASDFIGQMKKALAPAPSPAKALAAQRLVPDGDTKAAEQKGFDAGFLKGHRAGWDEGTTRLVRLATSTLSGLEVTYAGPKNAPWADEIKSLGGVGADGLLVPKGSSADISAAEYNGLRKAQRRVLNAIAWWEAAGSVPVKRDLACVVAGLSPKASTFGVYISELVKLGLVGTEPGEVYLTEAGKTEAVFPGVAHRRDLYEMARDILGGDREKAVFDVIYAAGGKDVSRDAIADSLELSRTASTCGVYISAVAAYGLIETGRRGMVKAAPWLFI